MEDRRDPMRYAPYFCEENVWHLAGDPAPPPQRAAVFVSGRRGFAMWGQRAAAGRDPIVWDYHVFLMARGAAAPWQAWDLDTLFGLPIDLAEYVDRSFRSAPDDLVPLFRVVDADELRRVFSSDRSHMIGADGRPTQPFPPWPRIGEGKGNLARFIDMDDAFVGERFDLVRFRERFSEEAAHA